MKIDTIIKQAEKANSAAEALQQIAFDLDSDPGAYDSDLQPRGRRGRDNNKGGEPI